MLIMAEPRLNPAGPLGRRILARMRARCWYCGGAYCK